MAGFEEVRMVESCFVTPAGDTPRKALRLSPLDLMLANRGLTPVVRFYRRRSTEDVFFDVTRLKTALAKALVDFYPMAGRLRAEDDGRLEIDCNNMGTLFLVAHSRLTIDDFSDFKPSPRLRKLFVPHVDDKAYIVCAIQVTFMKCGGVVLGTATHHGVVDGTAGLHFLKTWAAFCRDGDRAVVSVPYLDRTRLCARDPPVAHPDALSIFCPNIILSQVPGPAIVNEVLTLCKDQIFILKRICGGNGVSTFSAVSAHVWQCMCLARRLPPVSIVRLGFMADIRRRMMPPLPNGYFGNALINLNVIDEARAIASCNLAYIARRIIETLGQVNDEVVHSAVDCLEVASTERDNQPSIGDLPATDVRVVSWLGMPFYDLDFSWGKPLAMFRAVSNGRGFVHLMESTQGDGSVRLVICIEAAILGEFKRMLYAKFDNMVYSKF